MFVDTISARVAARFMGTEPELSEPLLTPHQLADELEPKFGRLSRVTIHPPDDDDPTVARWDAVARSGEVITGKITLDARWLNRVMLVYPIIDVDGDVAGSADKRAGLPRHLLDDKLRQVIVRLRRLVMQMRVRPDVPAHTLAGDLQSIIELAET